MTTQATESDTLADKLGRGVRMAGLIVKMPAPSIVEMAGLGGWDFVVIDMEHGLADGGEFQHHLRAADSVGIPVLVRVSSPSSPEILRVLDAGAEGIIVPHVAGRSDAERAIAAARYPPHGRRSLALSTRAGRYGKRSVAEHVADAAHVMVIAQIEDGLAVDRAAEITGCAGLDAVFIGPMDLSASLGVTGDYEHATVLDAVERVEAAVLAEDATALCVIAAHEDDALRWFDRGAQMVLFESSVLLARCLHQLADACHGRQFAGAASTPTAGDGAAPRAR